MNRAVVVRRPWILGALLVVTGGCGDDEPKGPATPELKKFVAVDGMLHETDLLTPVDGGIPAASPLARLRVYFNKLLDPAKIEGEMGPRDDVATITWTGAPAGAPAIMALTSYSPNGYLPGMPEAMRKFERRPHAGPSIWIDAKPALPDAKPGLPSGAMLVVTLDKTKVTDKKGTGYEGPATLSVQTEPFGAMLNLEDPTMPVAADHHLEVVFTNTPAAMIERHVRLTSGGAAVMAEVKMAMGTPSVTIEPMGGWVTGRTYTVTVAKEAADLFGVALGMEFSQTFTVGMGGGADAGGADASRDGSGTDAGADGAPDAVTDALGLDLALDIITGN